LLYLSFFFVIFFDVFFFFQAEDGIRDFHVTGVQTCALPIFAGTNCQYYAILRDINNKESYDYCFCIDESNNINNAESLFPNSKLKGLILSVEYKSENSYKLVYKSNQTASLKLDIDSDKLLADIEEYQKTVPVEMEP